MIMIINFINQLSIQFQTLSLHCSNDTINVPHKKINNNIYLTKNLTIPLTTHIIP